MKQENFQHQQQNNDCHYSPATSNLNAVNANLMMNHNNVNASTTTRAQQISLPSHVMCNNNNNSNIHNNNAIYKPNNKNKLTFNNDLMRLLHTNCVNNQNIAAPSSQSGQQSGHIRKQQHEQQHLINQQNQQSLLFRQLMSSPPPPPNSISHPPPPQNHPQHQQGAAAFANNGLLYNHNFPQTHFLPYYHNLYYNNRKMHPNHQLLQSQLLNQQFCIYNNSKNINQNFPNLPQNNQHPSINKPFYQKNNRLNFSNHQHLRLSNSKSLSEEYFPTSISKASLSHRPETPIVFCSPSSSSTNLNTQLHNNDRDTPSVCSQRETEVDKDVSISNCADGKNSNNEKISNILEKLQSLSLNTIEEVNDLLQNNPDLTRQLLELALLNKTTNPVSTVNNNNTLVETNRPISPQNISLLRTIKSKCSGDEEKSIQSQVTPELLTFFFLQDCCERSVAICSTHNNNNNNNFLNKKKSSNIVCPHLDYNFSITDDNKSLSSDDDMMIFGDSSENLDLLVESYATDFEKEWASYEENIQIITNDRLHASCHGMSSGLNEILGLEDKLTTAELFKVDFCKMPISEKPWLRQGELYDDYFNNGFNEEMFTEFMRIRKYFTNLSNLEYC